MKHKRIIYLLIILLFINPLLLILLTKSIIVTMGFSFLLLSLTFFVSLAKSLRLKVLFFNICAIFGICLHAELLFQEFMSDKNIPNLYELHKKYYFNKSYLNQEFKTNEYVSTYKTNCQGYRIDNLTNPHDSIKKCDWLFIGDSFTQGAQVNYNELYSSNLYKYFPNKIIVNAGISGAGLYDELNFFRDKGKQLLPKKIFLQIGVFNDFFNIKERVATYQDMLMEKSDLYRFLAYNIFTSDSLPLGRWTEPFFPTVEDNCNYNILYKPDSELKHADKVAFAKCLNEWKKEADNINAELILLLIPSKEQISSELLHEVIDKYKISYDLLDLTAPNRLFAQIATNLGLKAIDLTDSFKQSPIFPFFFQDEHLNRTGHQLIAETLRNEIKSNFENIHYISVGNFHERYPTYYKQDSIVLYQQQDKNQYYINTRSIEGSQIQTLITSLEELVHPVFSPDLRYLAYTEGWQDTGQTDVIVWDKVLNSFKRLNPANSYAAIPMFSHLGDKIAMPVWSDENRVANIHVYDAHRFNFDFSISSDKECWRPIFSKDDSIIYYIENSGYFKIKQYDVRNKISKDVLSVPYDIWDIALSPSGKTLVFAGNKDGNWDLFSYSLTDKNVCQLTYTLGDEWDPSFGETDKDLWYAGTFGINDGIFYKEL